MYSNSSWSILHVLITLFWSVYLYTLRDEVPFELLQELQIEQIIWGQSFFSYHGLHRLHVLTDSIACILRGRKERDQRSHISTYRNITIMG